MTDQDPFARAFVLGQDHAEEQHHTRRRVRLHSGHQVAAALGVNAADVATIVQLRERYSAGWASWA
ncbi:hypothetical protein ACIGCK_04670 [Microbacterium sp. NPDC078428]|uniref:hypothetical protein n=1 Tax=Microbacterium sp. NPDC078428 TaxID=3364190 RepID=UPI0037C6E305